MNFGEALALNRAAFRVMSDEVRPAVFPTKAVEVAGSIVQLVLPEEDRKIFGAVNSVLRKRVAHDLQRVAMGWVHQIADDSVKRPLSETEVAEIDALLETTADAQE